MLFFYCFLFLDANLIRSYKRLNKQLTLNKDNMKKLLLATVTLLYFTANTFAANEDTNQPKNTNRKGSCALKLMTVANDGSLVIEYINGWAYNLDCEKEQAKMDKISEKRIAMSKGDFRNIEV